MPKRPGISGSEMVRILEGKGHVHVRTKGSHARLYPPQGSGKQKVAVPLHSRLKPETLALIMRDAELSIDDLV